MQVSGGGFYHTRCAECRQARFAEDTEIGMALVRRRAGELAEAIRTKAQVVAAEISTAGFDGIALDKFARIAIDRADRIAAAAQRDV